MDNTQGNVPNIGPADQQGLPADPAPAPQTIDEWTKIFDGLTDDQIDEIVRIATTRASLTRNRPNRTIATL